MSNNKQSSVEWLHIEFQKRFPKETYEMYNNNQLAYEQMILQAKEMHEEELNVAYGNGYEQGEMDFYKKMQVKGDKYSEGYSEGYKRALELVKWKIDKDLQGGNNEQQ